MKTKILKNSILSCLIIVALVSCNKKEVSPYETINMVNPETVYLKTDYNLDMCAFALTVNEAISTNVSFRKLIKVEVDKMFDGDFDVLLTSIVDTKVENYELDENGTVVRMSGKVLVRDLLNSSFQRIREKAISQGDISFLERYKTRGTSI
ncbi:hypothetical protein FACS1894178_5450 [Bacteroidia bacterium]|nr:hypothetical protein FACS1894178_5450 [Bacteroidia bacterium]